MGVRRAAGRRARGESFGSPPVLVILIVVRAREIHAPGGDGRGDADEICRILYVDARRSTAVLQNDEPRAFGKVAR
jgi:hypothetical protein